MIDKEKLFNHLHNEFKLKKNQERFAKQINQIDNAIKQSNSYSQYLNKTKSIFNEIKRNNTNIVYQSAGWYGKNHCYHLKPTWRKHFQIDNFRNPLLVGNNVHNPDDTILDYFNDVKLFKTKYKHEKYIIERLVISDKPKTKEKEKLIDRLLVFLKQNIDIYEFIDNWIMDTTKAYMDMDIIYRNTITKLREERIYLYEYISTRKSLVDKSNYDEIKLFFEHDKKIVNENENFYPIMFIYENHIKKEILKANYKKETSINMFKYIAGLTLSKKWTAVKKYYHDTYLPSINR